MMITTNVSGVVDNWSNYFSQQVASYEPSSIIAKPWSKPQELEHLSEMCHTHNRPHKVSITIGPKTHCGHHHHMPCFNQHKPYGIASVHLMKPFEDDDRPDWQHFHAKNRKPMLFEEVIDHKDHHHTHHGIIAVRPVEPEIDKSEEIADEITL